MSALTERLARHITTSASAKRYIIRGSKAGGTNSGSARRDSRIRVTISSAGASKLKIAVSNGSDEFGVGGERVEWFASDVGDVRVGGGEPLPVLLHGLEVRLLRDSRLDNGTL